MFDADSTFQARFRQEAALVSRLSHPHVVALIEGGQTGPDDDLPDLPYLVAEYLPGGSLSAELELERDTRARCALAVSVAEQIGAALDYAHAQGVLHRDLKPSNILIAEDGRFVLSDFGLARVLQGGASLHLTATGLVAGTPAYMAPEQALGEPADARTDLYGLAVVLYEAISGQVPFEAETPLATMLAHVHQPPPAPRALRKDVPRAVEVVLLHALAKEPAERYESGAELAAALRAAAVAAYGERALSPQLASTLPAGATADGPTPPALPAVGGARGVTALPALFSLRGRRTPAPSGAAASRRERESALAARRPERRGRGERLGSPGRKQRVVRIVAAGLGACVTAGSLAAGGAAMALGPGRPTLASVAAQFAANSTGPTWTEASPRDGAPNQPLQTRIVIRFSHEMDHQAVESAFHLEPETPLAFEWDGRLLIASPLEELRESTPYVIALDPEQAVDAAGRPLVTPLRRRFTTQKRPAPVQAGQGGAAASGPGLPLFPFLQQPAAPTAQPTAQPTQPLPPSAPPPDAPTGARPQPQAPARPTATAARPTATTRREVVIEAPPPAPAYAPPTAPAQPPDTSIVAGLVVTSEQADAEMAGTPVATLVPTPQPSTTPSNPVALGATPASSPAAGANGAGTPRATTTRAAGVATATPARTPGPAATYPPSMWATATGPNGATTPTTSAASASAAAGTTGAAGTPGQYTPSAGASAGTGGATSGYAASQVQAPSPTPSLSRTTGTGTSPTTTGSAATATAPAAATPTTPVSAYSSSLPASQGQASTSTAPSQPTAPAATPRASTTTGGAQ